MGPCGNASLLIAPRARSRGVVLDGRSFLHDYDASQDTDGSVLELLMTAPMVVAHWINWQYHASTVDPLHLGSGNKVLHNVVGGISVCSKAMAAICASGSHASHCTMASAGFTSPCA